MLVVQRATPGRRDCRSRRPRHRAESVTSWRMQLEVADGPGDARCCALRPVTKLSTQMTSWPSAQQTVAQVRAEKAGAAGDQDTLARRSCRSRRGQAVNATAARPMLQAPRSSPIAATPVRSRCPKRRKRSDSCSHPVDQLSDAVLDRHLGRPVRGPSRACGCR